MENEDWSNGDRWLYMYITALCGLSWSSIGVCKLVRDIRGRSYSFEAQWVWQGHKYLFVSRWKLYCGCHDHHEAPNRRSDFLLGSHRYLRLPQLFCRLSLMSCQYMKVARGSDLPCKISAAARPRSGSTRSTSGII